VAEQLRIVTEREPAPLTHRGRLLRGDLATIVRTAFHRERKGRYGSAAELAADVGRYRRHEPIAARAPSAIYLLARFARRHRALAAAALAVLLALAGGAVATWRQARHAEAQRVQAVAARDFLQEVLVQASPLERDGKEFSVQRVLEIALERVDRKLLDQPAVEASVRHTLGRVQRALGLYPDARTQLTRAAELYEGPARDDVQLAYVLADLSGTHEKLGDLAAAEAAVRKALALGALGAEHAFLLGHAAGSLGIAQYVQGRLAEAERSFRESLAAYERLTDGRRAANVPPAQGLLALALQGLGRLEEAERLYRESLAGQRARGARDSVFATTLGNFAGLLEVRGARDEALALQREALDLQVAAYGADHPDAAFPRKEVGLLLFARGEREAGLREVRAALETQRRGLGDHPRVVQTLVQLAELEASAGEPERAAASLREALAMGVRTVGERHFLTNRARAALGLLLLDGGRAAEAVELLVVAHEVARAGMADRLHEAIRTGTTLGRALVAVERCMEAETVLHELVVELDRLQVSAGDAARRTVLEAQADLYERWGKPERAADCRRALAAR
jgi:serine/threonine-protein kinase